MTDDVNLRDQLGIDSLRAMEILVAVEQKYGIKIDEARAFDVMTFRDLTELAKEYVKGGI